MRFSNLATASKRSIKKDLIIARKGEKKSAESINGKNKRIKEVLPTSSYYKYSRYIVGRLVRITGKGLCGNVCEFVHDEDRQALNNAAGWSDRKKEYIFDSVIYK